MRYWNNKNWVIKGIVSLLSLFFVACNGKTEQTIPISFIVITDAAKTQINTGQIVNAAPITIIASAAYYGKGTMEIFDGDKSLGVLDIKQSSNSILDVNRASIDVPLTKTDNGLLAQLQVTIMWVKQMS
jgi:hypothetical protein